MTTEASPPLLPIGVWVRVRAPQMPHPIPAWTYVDPEAGPSAHGMMEHDGEHARIIIRMNPPLPFEPMTDEQRQQVGLPEKPPGMEVYGPQPPAGTLWGEWRSHPHLANRLTMDGFPDDLPVTVHDGGPRFSPHTPEQMWVRVTGVDENGPAGLTVFRGTLLNAPFHLQSVKQFQTVKFVCPEPAGPAVFVSDAYLAERDQWVVEPCQNCHLPELFDSPYDLLAAMNAGIDGEMMPIVTSLCPMCDGMLMAHWVRVRTDQPMDEMAAEWKEHLRGLTRTPRQPLPGGTGLHGRPQAGSGAPAPKRKWWQIWKR